MSYQRIYTYLIRRFINRKWNVSWEELVLYWILTANKIANLTQHVNSIQLFLFIHHINAVSLIENKMYICCCWFDILLYWPLPTNVSVLWFITYRRTHIKSFCYNSFPLLIHSQTNHWPKFKDFNWYFIIYLHTPFPFSWSDILHQF